MAQIPNASQRAAQDWVVDDRHDGQRIDNFLITFLKGVPKSHVYRILRTGQVRVNGRRIKPAYRLQIQDKVRIPPMALADTAPSGQPSAKQCQRMREAILFDEQGLLVINKPAGVAVHGGSGVSFGVIEILRTLFSDAPLLELVHRLDRDTSGCLMVARKRSVLRHLHDLLRADGSIEKRYVALLAGRVKRDKLMVRASLKKNVLRSGERVVRVDDTEGRESVTEFRVLARFADATLVEAIPRTGRTHQIRVHAAHIGHPIAGDPKYGSDEVNRRLTEYGVKRLFLHAASLTFTLPGRPEPVRVEAPLPPELERVLMNLRTAGAPRLGPV